MLTAANRADARLLDVKFEFDISDGFISSVKSDLEGLKLLCQFFDL